MIGPSVIGPNVIGPSVIGPSVIGPSVIVVDASVITNALTDDGQVGRRARAELGAEPHWVAPGHLAADVFSAVRGRRLGRKISDERAREALEAFTRATLDLIDTVDLIPRMWELRGTVTGYDAAYIAAAEVRACALVIADHRLAGVPGVGCAIVLAPDLP